MRSGAYGLTSSVGMRVLLFGSGALVWAAPWMPAAQRNALRSALAPICHQLPERTIVLAGHTMAACSRCAGVYAGIAAGALFVMPRVGRGGWRIAFAVAAVALALDVLAQTLRVHPVWHATRLLTGAACGYTASAWLIQEASRKSPYGGLSRPNFARSRPK